MDNNVFTEARLPQDVADKLKKKGIKKTSDELGDASDNTIIDISKKEWKSDSSYIKDLSDVYAKTKSFGSKIIYIPVSKWYRSEEGKAEDNKNPLGSICRYMKQSPQDFKKKFSGAIFIFYNDAGESFIVDADKYKSSDFKTVSSLINELISHTKVKIKIPTTTNIEKSPVKDVVDEKKAAKESLDNKKKELVAAIAQAAEESDSEEEAWDILDNDEYVKQLLADIEDEDDGKPKFNTSRIARMSQLNSDFMDKKINNTSIKDIISKDKGSKELPIDKSLKVSSINKEDWDNVKFTKFQDQYDINKDILSMLQSLSTKSYPISIVDIKVEDTSTNQDYVDTYTVNVEDGFGKRSTLVFDIPKFKNKR